MTNAEKFKTPEEQTEAYKDFCRMQSGCLRCPAYCESVYAICQFVWLRLEAPKDNTIKVQSKMIEDILDNMRKASAFMDESHRREMLRYADYIERTYNARSNNENEKE